MNSVLLSLDRPRELPQHRDAEPASYVHSNLLIWNDLRYAFRSFGRTPGFTTLAVLTIAVGIGANSAIFSVVNSVLLRPLPFTDSGRIVQIVDNGPVGLGAISSSFPKFSFLHDHARSFSDIAGVGLC